MTLRYFSAPDSSDFLMFDHKLKCRKARTQFSRFPQAFFLHASSSSSLIDHHHLTCLFRSVILALLNLESPLVFQHRLWQHRVKSFYLSSKILLSHPSAQLKLLFRFLYHSLLIEISFASCHCRFVQIRNGIFRSYRAQHNRLLVHNQHSLIWR